MDWNELPPLAAATLIGCLAGVGGTGLGGLFSILVRNLSSRTYSVILGAAAGVMLAIVGFDLMPEAIAVGGIRLAIIGVLSGAILVSLLDLLPHRHFMTTDRNSRFIKTGVIIGLGIAMHNLPEGLAIGAGYTADKTFGLGLAIVIALHNLPEGMAMACPMIIGGVHPLKVLAATAAAGLPMGIGAFVGSLLGSVSPAFLSVCLGFAAGAMLFVTCDELIPDAHELASGHSGTYGIVGGVIAGIILTSVLAH